MDAAGGGQQQLVGGDHAGASAGGVEAGTLAALTSPAVSTCTGGVASLVGVGVLGLALPAVWNYDAGRAPDETAPTARQRRVSRRGTVRRTGPGFKCQAQLRCGDDGRVRLPVFVQGWQVECCAATFSVGNVVSWGLAFGVI